MPDSSPTDTTSRIPAREIVRRIEAQMAGNASDAVKSYQINNRRLDRYSIPELLELLKYWRQRAAREASPNGRGPRISFYL